MKDNTPTPEQVAACQAPRPVTNHTIDYVGDLDDAAARMRRGEKQWFCVHCARWKWPGTECGEARLLSTRAWRAWAERETNDA